MRWNPITKHCLGFKEKNSQKERNRQFVISPIVISPMCTHQVGYRICAERPHNSGPFHSILKNKECGGQGCGHFWSRTCFNCPIEILHDILVRNGRFASGFEPLIVFRSMTSGINTLDSLTLNFEGDCFPCWIVFAIAVHKCCCTFFFETSVSLFQLTMTRQMVYIVFDSQCSPVSMNREILKDPNYLVQNKRNQRNPLGSVV